MSATRTAKSGVATPLDNTRERNMVPLLVGGLAATALLIAGAWVVDKRVERARIGYVGEALAAAGHGEATSIEPTRGDDCWRAAEGFRWRTEGASGYACAGPRTKVVIFPDGTR